MKRNALNQIKVVAILFVTLILTFGCSDLINDPMKDKKTGADLTLLLLDPNFFDTKFIFNFVDSTGEYVTGKEIMVYFSGEDAQNIVSYNGEKLDSNIGYYLTTSGRLELALDPNFEFSESNPLEFLVNARVDDRSWFSYPTEVTLTQKGDIDINVELIKNDNFKSVALNPGSEPFDIKFNGTIIPKTGEWSYKSNLVSKDGKQYYGWFYPTQAKTGKLTATNLIGDANLIEKWGVEGKEWSKRNYNDLSQSINFSNVGSSSDWYSATKRNNMQKCTKGLNIKVSEQFGQQGTAKFNYTITANNEVIRSGKIGSSQMPFTVNTGAFYYPSDATSVIVKITGDGQYKIEPSEITVTNFCGATIGVTAKALNGLVPYKLISSITCAGNPLGITPSMNGKFKIKDSNDPWTYFSFKEGICTLLLKPGATYSMEGTMGELSAEFDFPTDESKIAGVVSQALKDNKKELDNILYSITENSTGKTIKIDVFYKEGYCPF